MSRTTSHRRPMRAHLERPMGRRGFLALMAGALVPLPNATGRTRLAGLLGAAAPLEHPDPRPGVDASRVLPADAVAPHVADLYDRVRAIPHVVDGIGCHCGCAEIGSMYSLLSCYEESGMAQYCEVCQGEGRLAHRLHEEGRTLDEIRTAIDRRFGSISL